MNEADVSTKLRVALASLGAVAWKVSDRFHASRPDLVICNKGGFIAIEVKIFPALPTELQKWTLVELHNAGAYVTIASYDKKTKNIRITEFSTGNSTTFTDIREAAPWLLRQRS